MSTRDPKDRKEGSTRSTRDIAIEFLKVQEEALASEPLPLSRREHVLRYFRALRKQIEGQSASEDRKSTRLNSSHIQKSRMPSSA